MQIIKKYIRIIFLFTLLFTFCACKIGGGNIDVNDDIDEKVTITFHYYEGKDETIEIKKGTKLDSPERLLRDNYLFEGWYADALLNNVYVFGTEVSENITLYAKWLELIPASYEIKFEVNGASLITKQNVEAGGLVSRPADPTKDGYRFINWYIDQALTREYDFTSPVNNDLTLYAKWEKIEPTIYEVSFEVNGGNDITKQQIEAGSIVSRPADPTKDNYRFVNWYTDQNFTNQYDFASPVNSSFILYAKWIKTINVVFYGKDNNQLQIEVVDEGEKLNGIFDAPKVTGFTFLGWYIDGTNTKIDFETYQFLNDTNLIAIYEEEVISSKITFLAEDGYEESATIKFAKISDATSYNIYLNNNCLTEKDYYLQEKEGIIRVDLFGLKAGNYKFRVVPVINGNENNELDNETETINVQAYDRSGYAHFNYNEGVGAYNNDGSLKANAIVLYVTDENKNSVTLTYKGTTVIGIGNILNSVGEACGESGHENQCKKVSNGHTYYGKGNTNQGILLKLAQDNIPLVVRFVGCVSDSGLYEASPFDASNESLINGLTGYNGYDYGGSVGDNGHMARMKSAKNITLEGVGDDAIIDGWGFHLICETSHSAYAKNFEVRNLTFINTPEDAIGMEGQENESTLTITASVERCWIHHNCFIGPTILSPAESDKSEGDGSCDFKRGRYFTCSYNYFEGCHKTNLVGSSKTSVQFCLTYHHNLWYNCSARQPLARRANIHFYNNFIYGTTDTVSSLRANAYMYSENNYYLGCSRPVSYNEETTAGVCKSFGNILVGCYNSYDAYVASSRIEAVNSNCTDGQISYVNFDTNSSLFYYDNVNKKSDCYLTSANVARIECLAKSGSRYRTNLDRCLVSDDPNITNVASSSTISANTTLSINKGKGVLKVFSVVSDVMLTISATSENGYNPAYLLKMNGELVLAISSSDQEVILNEGTYVIVAGQSFTGNNNKNDKEATITKCVFELYDEATYFTKLINNYNNALSLIPNNITYTDECYDLINNATEAYEKLGSRKDEVNNDKLVASINSYKEAGSSFVEGKISLIVSPVTNENASLVLDARSALDKLLEKFSDVIISNLDELEAAEIEVSNLNSGSPKIECTFDGSPSNDSITVSGNYSQTSITIAGTSYTKGLKMESSTSVTFTLEQTSKLTLHVTPGKIIKIDGTNYNIEESGILVINNLQAGEHTISKNTTNTILYYLSIE